MCGECLWDDHVKTQLPDTNKWISSSKEFPIVGKKVEWKHIVVKTAMWDGKQWLPIHNPSYETKIETYWRYVN